MSRLYFAVLLLSTFLLADDVTNLTAVTESPSIDGRLNEPLWEAAYVVDDFFQRAPVEGAAPSEITEIRIAYTSYALLIGVIAYENHPDKIVATTRRRDDWAITSNDQIAFAIDARNDRRNGFWFSTNPFGMQIDAQFYEEGERWEDNWNGDWQVASSIDSTHWSAEFEIPFSTLGFGNSDEKIIGINFFRRLIHSNEELFSPLIPLSYKHGTADVSLAPRYRLSNIQGGRSIYIQPYLLGNRLRPESTQVKAVAVGGDSRMQINDQVALGVTINTDFAQAEADDRQINLSRFNLFFPEKRDFFLENTGNFTLGDPEEVELFFSRRIGLETGDDGTTLAVPIKFGSRLAGKLGRSDVGLLSMSVGAGTAQPAHRVNVFRLKQPVAERSYIGGIITGINGAGSDLTAGIDGSFILPGQVAVTGFIAGTGTNPVKSWSPNQLGSQIRVRRLTERASFDVGILNSETGFNPALGFIARPATRKQHGLIAWPVYLNSDMIWRVVPKLRRTEYYQVGTTILESALTDIELGISMVTKDAAYVLYQRATESLSDPFAIFRDIKINPGIYQDNRLTIGIQSSPNRRLSSRLTVILGGLFGEDSKLIDHEAVWKMNDAITVNPYYQIGSSSAGGEAFTTRLYRLRIAASWNTRFSISTLSQYDNSSQRLSNNVYISYLHREGTELYFIWNQSWTNKSTDSAFTQLVSEENNIILKYSYRWNK